MRQYVSVRPDDVEALSLLAEWCETNARGGRVLFQALVYDRTRRDLARRAIRIEEKLNRHAEALSRLKALGEHDAELTSIEARCLSALGKSDLATSAYVAAIERAPKEVRNYDE